MKIELSDEEAGVLQNLLDVACRARGLEAAEACLVFCRKLVEAKEAKRKPRRKKNVAMP